MEKLAEKIEIMTKDDQIEVLRFFVSRNLKVNENKNGCFINLSTVKKETIDELITFIDNLYFEAIDDTKYF